MAASAHQNLVAAGPSEGVRQRRANRNQRLLVLLALAGLVASIGIYYSLLSRERGLIEAEFHLAAERRADAVSRELDDNLGLVGALQAFFEGSQSVERDEFAAFAGVLVQRYNSIHELAWVPAVPAAERAPLEASMRRDVPGSLGFVESGSAKELVPASTRATHYPVFFMESAGKAVLPLGFDLASNHAFAEAVTAARDSGSAAVADESSLPPHLPLARAVLVAAPVYAKGERPPQSVAERRERFEGVVVGMFLIGTIFDNAVSYLEPLGIDIQLIEWDAEPADVDVERTPVPADAVRVLYVRPSVARARELPGTEASSAARDGPLSHRFPLKVPGRHWWLYSTPTDVYLAHRRTWLPPTVLLIGFLVTGLGTMYLAALLGRTAGVEALVDSRTTELQEANLSLQREVSVRERAEGVLRESESLYSSLVENLPVFVLRKNLEGQFIFVNRALCEALGKTAEEILGRTDFDLYPHNLAAKYHYDDRRVAETGERFECVEEYHKDGQQRYMQVIKIPVLDSAGSVAGVQAVFWDVTERRTFEMELERARDAAEAANRAKSAFLANMSHEIRTPMNAIIGMADLLQHTSVSAEQQEYLRTIQDSGDSLLMVLNDILDFSKIDAGRLDLDRSPFDLHESLGDTMKLLACRAHAQRLELTYHIAPDVPRVVVGDRTRLRQVLVNLVGNAIKFTRRGEVVLDARVESLSADGVVVHFSVRDTGIGIAPDKLKIIFEAFEQADATTTREFGGTGLGLAISARLAQLMEGRIWAESELGKGSTFHWTASFGLPVEQPPVVPETVLVHLRGMPVLVVDDNATNREILVEVLRGWAMEPVAVAGAEDALHLLHERRQSAPFRLVLTDANMPGMDGFSLVRQINADEDLAGTVIMMLSSGDPPGDVARCEQIGLRSYLMKPVKRSELLQAVADSLDIACAPQSHCPAEPRATRLRPLRILLAEDSLVNQRLVMGLLGKHGHSIVVAGSGREALAAALSQTFDVVLMDVQMPEMDGLQATAALRAEEARTGRRRVPVVAMTAHAMRGDRARCLEAGMDEYVAKPIRVQQLLEVLESVVDPSLVAMDALPQENGPIAAPPEGGISDATGNTRDGRAQENERKGVPLSCTDGPSVIDWSKALSAAGGDADLLHAIAEALLTDGPCELAAMRRAVAHGDAAALRRACHTLKGAIEYFGAGRAFELAFEIERLAKEDDLTRATARLPELESEMDRVLQLLVEYTRR